MRTFMVYTHAVCTLQYSVVIHEGGIIANATTEIYTYLGVMKPQKPSHDSICDLRRYSKNKNALLKLHRSNIIGNTKDNMINPFCAWWQIQKISGSHRVEVRIISAWHASNFPWCATCTITTGKMNQISCICIYSLQMFSMSTVSSIRLVFWYPEEENS